MRLSFAKHRISRLATSLKYSSSRNMRKQAHSFRSVQFLSMAMAGPPHHYQLHCHRCLSSRKKVSKIPDKPVTILYDSSEALPEVPEIDLALVEQLERMSLVEFATEKGLQELKNAVKSANQLLLINTDGLEPLDSVLEDRPLWLRDDEVKEGNCTEEILSNATKTEEQYFVAPPGNIPLKKKTREHFSNFLGKESKEESDT